MERLNDMGSVFCSSLPSQLLDWMEGRKRAAGKEITFGASSADFHAHFFVQGTCGRFLQGLHGIATRNITLNHT